MELTLNMRGKFTLKEDVLQLSGFECLSTKYFFDKNPIVDF